MFSVLQRGQQTLNLAMTLVGFISAFVAVVSILQLYTSNAWELPSVISNVQPTATVKFSRKFGSNKGVAKENNKLTFDLQSDLTPLFNWNTKQIFVYLTAEYPGKSDTASNKVTYWDKIITSPKRANISLTNERSAYSVWDIEETFRNREAIVKLEWSVQPYVGLLTHGSTAGETIVVFPDPPTEEEMRKAKMERRKSGKGKKN
ncbi:Microsomal signal peptidase subunit 3 [Cyberlindnera fabianii]|uniref:Signal peptidase subunit 3 n=1 Tax=Cyberlindnera fabianii TaxID=36022 RepID=A0A1V2LBM4_CYBFA|nr:Microsomal signal peptidase subunit 3 [Cyberlindnera fabianii]